MATHPNASALALKGGWFKSSYSDGTGNNCVEVARITHASAIAIRDSKHPTGPALLLPAPAWSAFITRLPEM
ncbi:DUF397 domain-containing protein [Streptomyces sp. T028]|uniref:DUF397 domain-containing protein n=1 Tax=Streptomyces sp. T028 TaxID=3394379 RepID=UPI003A8A84B3